MPCYDGRSAESSIEYRNGVDPEPLEYEIFQLKENVKKLAAGLCAIITELEQDGIANQILSQASKSGLIDLMDFWDKHRKTDETRLAKELHKYSEHEQAVFKRLLNEEK